LGTCSSTSWCVNACVNACVDACLCFLCHVCVCVWVGVWVGGWVGDCVCVPGGLCVCKVFVSDGVDVRSTASLSHTNPPNTTPIRPQRKSDKGAQAAVMELYVRKIYKMHKIKSVDAYTSLNGGNGK
jgi:hypothetical protein